MTYTIELAPAVERALTVQATRQGITVDELLRILAEAEATRAVQNAASLEDTAALVEDAYTQSLATGGELTAFSNAQEDLHEYTPEELAAMEAGEFERPQATRHAALYQSLG